MREKYQKLLNAYSEKNLTEITSKLIHLYKRKNINALQKIAQIVSDFTVIKDGSINSIFSQLIMLYHPDKSKRIIEKINFLLESGKDTGLKAYLHILELEDLDDLIAGFTQAEDIELEEDYVWEQEEDHFKDFEDDKDLGFDYNEPDTFDFYNAVKKKIYGNRNINFPPHYLEEYEEIEMSNSGIEDLSGVEYCKHVIKFHLNDNQITDITNLENLENIEELYIANNQIGFIDALENLVNLRILDLSFNQIDDISPLMELDNLEYVNLLGNPIPKNQINELKNNEILVIF
ncbi:MAG: leucine-rich repeat domain-containing protein [Candidatus Marinimicrobia bacterium]|nr:leucine-rich repeat domain-containing protein [Candidatus Neomarinimicrobiota bacterium]